MKKASKNTKPIEDMVANDLGAERKVHSLEIRQRLERAVEKLPPKQREVFVLRQMLDLSFREVAVIVDASENTVKSRMRYALEALRLELHDFYHQDTRIQKGGV